jgi:Iron-dependent Transcriptional regulator
VSAFQLSGEPDDAPGTAVAHGWFLNHVLLLGECSYPRAPNPQRASGIKPLLFHSAKTLAAQHGLPPRHLDLVLQSLVHGGILRGVRGPNGGYELAREPHSVTVQDILRAAGNMNEAGEEPNSEIVAKVVLPILSVAERELFQLGTEFRPKTERRCQPPALVPIIFRSDTSKPFATKTGVASSGSLSHGHGSLPSGHRRTMTAKTIANIKTTSHAGRKLRSTGICCLRLGRPRP